MKNLIIYGASQLGHLAKIYFTTENQINALGFIVDPTYKQAKSFAGLPVFSWEEVERNFNPKSNLIFVAIGYRDMEGRARVFDEVTARGYSSPNLISKHAFVAENVEIGANNFIMPGAVIEPGVKLGNNNVIWSNATICHDTVIGSHNFFAANVTIGGEVKIGTKNFFGFSSVVRERRSIGNNSVVGASSLVMENISDNVTSYGIPAKISPKN